MAPAPFVSVLRPLLARGLPQPKEPNNHERKDESLDEVILEAWSQGFLVGGLIVLIMITVANMRRGVLLHKLILLELIMALGHGTFIFTPDPIYGWHLSATAIFLYLSWYLHNIVAWMKNKPFLPHWGSMLYIGTVILIFPYWICEMYYNFAYFNALGNDGFRRTRPWEALARDPWWIFTTCNLVYVIKREYKFGLIELIRASPRFGVLIFSMLLSIVFLLTDVIVTVAHIGGPSGINPYWKLALVFKCAADALFLDDFKKVLDVLITHTLQKVANPATGRPQTMQINNHDIANYNNNNNNDNNGNHNNNNNNNNNNTHHQRGDSSARTDSEAPEIAAIAKQDFGLQPIHPIVTSESYGTIVPAARARSFDGSCSGDDDYKGSHRHANIFNMPGFNRRRRSSDESFGNWDDLPLDMTPIPPPAAAPAPEITPITPPTPENPRPSREWQQTFHQKQGLAPFQSPPGPSGRHSAVEWYDVTRGPRPPGATSPARSEPRMNTSPTRIEPRSDPGYDPRMRYEPAPGFAREDTPPVVPNRSPARSVRTPDGSTHSGTPGGRVGTPDGSTHSGRLPLANRGGLGGNVI